MALAFQRSGRQQAVLISQELWRMFADRTQHSSQVDQRPPVQSQCVDGGAAHGRQTQDQAGVLTPREVGLPILYSGVFSPSDLINVRNGSLRRAASSVSHSIRLTS